MTLITRETQLNKASLYHYYPGGKVQMAEEVLSNVIEKLKTEVLSYLTLELSPSKKIKGMLLALDQFYCRGQDQCFLSIFSLGEISPKVEQSLREATEHWVQLLSQSYQEMNLKNPDVKARQILANIQGALLVSKVTKRSESFTEILHQIAQELVEG